MVSNWQLTRLGDQVDLLTGFPFRSEEYSESETDVALLRGDNIIQGNLRWENVKRWRLTKNDQMSAYFLKEADVVLAMDRPWIEAGLKYAAISNHDLPCLLVQRVARLRAKSELDQHFLKYLIGSKAFTDYVLGVQTGTAVPHISGQQIKDFEFLCPPLNEQREIAQILGSLDAKIDLNRRMNTTLEAIAHALFQSWFVDFDPVRAKAEGREPQSMDRETAALFPNNVEESQLGQIPRGWQISTIGEEVQVLGGSTPSTMVPSYWEEGFHFWATPKDLSDLSTPVLLSTSRQITDEGLQQISSGLLPEGTVLLSSRAPIGYLAIAAVPVAINQGFIALVCDRHLSNYYALLWTAQNMDIIKAKANGTTFLEISKGNFRSIPVLVPPDDVLRVFDDTVSPLFKQIVNNERISRTLAVMRDVLLPKLISGEVNL